MILINDQTPPEGYKKIDVNLNAATIRGDSIHLWYKTDSKTKADEAVQELAIEYGKDAVTPFGWNKINVDLNSEKEGKGSFGEATYLFFKRGYQALPEIPRLVFDENSQFKILQLGDLHLTNEKGECRDVPVDVMYIYKKENTFFIIVCL